MARYLYQPRRSCLASFKTIYGIGKVKASCFNRFLLFHPNQTRFKYDFRYILFGSRFSHLWDFIPTENRIRLFVEHNLRKKSMVFCFAMFRLFQNLPTKGQRTKANGNSIRNYNPYTSLHTNLAAYKIFEVSYKKMELLHNERHEELKAFTEAIANKIKMRKTDNKIKKKKAIQEFIKKSRRNAYR